MSMDPENSWAWAGALVAVAFIVTLLVSEVAKTKADNEFRVACVQAGGSVGVERGNPTCDR